MDFIVSGLTDIGISKKTNQDSLTIKTARAGSGKVCFAVLCDGMGGLEKGEVASSNLIRAFEDWFFDRVPQMSKEGYEANIIFDEWNNIIQKMNVELKKYGAEKGIHLGTTIVSLLIAENKGYLVNVGDSRVYRIDGQLNQLTKDQTLVQREFEKGNLTYEEMARDPRRSVLLQCVGASEDIVPEFKYIDVNKDEVYLLCSDGFRHEISEEEIYSNFNPQALYSYEDMERNSRHLIEENKKREEKDNISVVLVRTY